MDERTLIRQDGQPAGDVTLADWVAHHGPLWPDVALVIALELCAQASHMTDSELDALIGSLNAKRIIRGSTGSWEWRPTRAASSAAGTTDADVIERLGALLFHAVTGRPVADPLAEEATVRTRLRNQRPDLTAPVADSIVRALSTRQSRPWPLDMFARDVGRAIGLTQSAPRPQPRRGLTLVTTVTALAFASALWWLNVHANDQIESHGLTNSETVLVDVTEERAQALALADEHTAAIQEYQQLARWWSARVPPEDPRLAWNMVHEAWVRTLRSDRLTTEQQLGSVEGATTGLGVSGTTARLTASLGDGHPYTRTARLELAATLEARGANAEAARLREQAENSARELIGDTSVLLGGVPTPPGVVAHLAPNAPEREGFRRANAGGFFVPLTSIQRFLAGRDGWRLHVIAGGTCRASTVLGNIPHRIAVNISRGLDKTWQLRIEGTRPPLTLARPASERVGVSLIADRTGMLQARLGEHGAHSTAIDPAAVPPDPPYSLAFEGGPGGDGCTVVWLEIPFPFEPKS